MPVRISERVVMEVLAAEYQIHGQTIKGSDADILSEVEAMISKRTKAAVPAINDPDVIDGAKFIQGAEAMEVTETGAGAYASQGIILHDFASSGKGFLVAATSVFVQTKDISSTSAGTASISARLLMRLVKVSAEELIGLVSQ